jgi:hypothetical protein
VLERERIVEGDWLAMKQASPARDAAAGSGETGLGRAWRTAGLVALGGLLGAIAMVAAAWFSA